jgi:hypothetical protein
MKNAYRYFMIASRKIERTDSQICGAVQSVDGLVVVSEPA